MTVDAGAGVGIVTLGPGFVGTTIEVANIKSYTTGRAVIARCPSVPHPRLVCSESEHELRYVFNFGEVLQIWCSLERGNCAFGHAG